MQNVFEGLKVIDCASYIGAPAAATIMSDFGAEVIKVEPFSGDPYRGQRLTAPDIQSTLDTHWMLDSRNKKSLALDLASAKGADVLHRIVSGADVFITNYPPKVRQKLKISYDTLSAINPRLIYAAFSGFGEAGPEVNKAGFDATVWWARSGLMDLMRTGESPPMRLPIGMGDHSSATSLYAAIITALYKRERTGRGDFVGTSLLMNGYWTNASSIQMSICGVRVDRPPERIAFPTPLRNAYKCVDGRWLLLTVVNTDDKFAAFRKALQSPLLHDPKFDTLAGREEHRHALTMALDEILATRKAAEWSALLDSNNIPAGVATPVAETWKDEQARLAGAIVPTDDVSGVTVSSPFFMQSEEKRVPQPAPAIGQHSDEILRAVGFSADEIEALRGDNVVR